MYKQIYEPESMKSASCPECGCKRLLLQAGKLKCTDCGHIIGKTFNKYGAIKTKAADGTVRDSKYEASVADELLTRKRAGDIKDYESQFKVESRIYREDGTYAYTDKHKVDFRIHHNDGSFELYEAKGRETEGYRLKRKNLENVWLPLHKDHIYTVVKQRARR